MVRPHGAVGAGVFPFGQGHALGQIQKRRRGRREEGDGRRGKAGLFVGGEHGAPPPHRGYRRADGVHRASTCPCLGARVGDERVCRRGHLARAGA